MNICMFIEAKLPHRAAKNHRKFLSLKASKVLGSRGLGGRSSSSGSSIRSRSTGLVPASLRNWLSLIAQAYQNIAPWHQETLRKVTQVILSGRFICMSIQAVLQGRSYGYRVM